MRPDPPNGLSTALALLLLLLGGCAEPTDEPDGGPSVDDGPSAVDGTPGDAAPGDAARPMTTDMGSSPPDAGPDSAPDTSPHERPDAMPDAMPDTIEAPVGDAMVLPRPDAAPAPEGPTPYPADRAQSPLTPWVVDTLRGIADAAPRAPDVFAKIGDSVTVSRSFMRCFATDDLQLDGRDHLWPTIERFRMGDAGGTDPYRRESSAARVGWSVFHALRGDPAPLEVELELLDPRFAVVMFGTNDIQNRDIDGYAIQLWDLIDRVIDSGTIPIMSTVMPRDDDPDADALVPRYNAVVRAIAQGRQVPLVDLHRLLAALPDHGLGPDRLHPSAAPTGACDLSPDGLLYGYNIRNLLTITALDRARRALEPGEAAPDPPHPRPAATGGVADPIVIDRLPFTDLRDTRDSPHRALDAYPGCDAPQDESGPEFVYALRLDRPTIVRARVFDRGDDDIDLHLLADPVGAGACLDRAHRTIEASLGPGTWYFVLDTYVDGGTERSGPFLFTLIEG